LKSGYQGRFGDQSMPTLLLLGNGSAADVKKSRRCNLLQPVITTQCEWCLGLYTDFPLI